MNSLSSAENRRIAIGLCFALVLMVWFVFGQTLTFDFVNYDDPQYVIENQLVQGGITWEGVVRAITHSDYSFYHPFTTLSHMLDYEIYGLNPAGFHFTNVVLHTLSAVILFLVLRSMTGSLWKSFIVAAIFAIHPLRAESVAWITERKDCLSGVFFMLTLAAYVRYVRYVRIVEGRRSKVEGGESSPQNTQNESGELSADCADGRRWERRGRGWRTEEFLFQSSIFNRQFPLLSYCLVFVCMVASMLSKATVVTLPFVLLLLDFWPLKRFGRRGVEECEGEEEVATKSIKIRRKDYQQPTTINHSLYFFVLEKIPFFLLSLAVSVVMLLSSGKSMHSLEGSSLSLRLGNALVSYVTYILQFFVPINLAVLYPFPTDPIPFWKSGSCILILGIIILFLVRRLFASYIPRSTSVEDSPILRVRNFPAALAVGWLWFLGMLFPMIGVVQAGQQAHADRYTYLSQIGLVVMVVWGVGEWCSVRRRRLVLGFVSALVGLLALMGVARLQTAYWRNSVSLWDQTLAHTSNNFVAHSNLGTILFADGKTEESIEHFVKSLRIQPRRPEVWNNLAIAYAEEECWGTAVKTAQQALALAEKQSDVELATAVRSRLKEYKDHFQRLK